MVGSGDAWSGRVGYGKGLIADRGLEIVLLRVLRRGTARLGGVWHGLVGRGARNSRLRIINSPSPSVNGKAGHGLARRGVVRFGVARTSNSR